MKQSPDELNPPAPCVCGFGEEFFTIEADRHLCTICGGVVGLDQADGSSEFDIPTGKNILAVDDQAFFRQRIRQILVEQGNQVAEAEDGLGAVKAIGEVYFKGLGRGRRPFDAVILDLIMPGEMDGFRTLAVIKTLLPNMPVIILTATPPTKELLQKLAKLGAKKYINKSAANLDSLVAKNIKEI